MTTKQTVERLNQLKKQQGLTLSDLAARTGLAQGTINKIMSGALQRIKQDKLELLANALNVDVQYLTNENYVMPTPRKVRFGMLTVAPVAKVPKSLS